MTTTDRPTREDALLPCPFCGGKPEKNQVVGSNYVPTHYWVSCSDCSLQAKNKDESIRKWNTRAGIVIDRDKVPVGLKEAVAFRQPNYDRNMDAIKNFYGMNCDRPEKSHDDKLFEAAALLAEKVEE